MDLEDSHQEGAFRAEARAWIAANAPRHLRPRLEAALFATLPLKEDEYVRAAKQWQAKKAAAGWACLHWPREYGGRGATAVEQVIWRQEEGIYARLSGLFSIGLGMCAPTLMAYASEEQKRRYLPPLGRGEEVWCQLFSEPAAGSDLAGLRTRCVLHGDEWILNGQKVWSSFAHLSEYGIVVTRSDPDAPKHKGLTFFFVDMSSPGIEVRPIKQLTGHSDFNEVFFSDVRVPDAQRLGEVGEGWTVALTTLMNERLSLGSSVDTGVDDLLAFVRSLGGDGAGLLEDGAVRQALADWYVKSSGLTYTTYRMLSALGRGEPPGPEASIGKLVAAGTLQEIASLALELQGAGGVLADPELAAARGKFQTLALRSLAARIEGGTDEILRNVIAERVLGLPSDIRVDRDVPFREIPRGSV